MFKNYDMCFKIASIKRLKGALFTPQSLLPMIRIRLLRMLMFDMFVKLRFVEGFMRTEVAVKHLVDGV